MHVHRNAKTTPKGRALIVQRVDADGWTVRATARAFGVSERTVHKWRARYRVGGFGALVDRRSVPRRVPGRTPAAREAAILALRRQRLSGVAIAHRLRVPRSTVGAVLRRLGVGRLQALGRPAAVQRYERARGRGARARRHQVTRAHPGDRPSHSRGPAGPHPGRWVGARPCVRGRCEPRRLRRSPPDAAARRCRRFLGARGRVVCASRRADRARDDRQRLGIPLAGLERLLHAVGTAARSHAAVYAAHERQGGALHPDSVARVGIRPPLPNLRAAPPCAATLATLLQRAASPHEPQRSTAALSIFAGGRVNNVLGHHS